MKRLFFYGIVSSLTLLYISCFLFMNLLSSCLSTNEDAENAIHIYNSTGDTIIFAQRHGTVNSADYELYDFYLLLPYQNLRYGGNYSWSIYELLYECFSRYDYEIQIFQLSKNESEGLKVKLAITADSDWYYIDHLHPLISWYPPLRSLPDSIHDFYNFNSWEITQGGVKNKWDIGTFTIREEDLKQKE